MQGFSSDVLFDFDTEISRYANPDKPLNWKEKVIRNLKTFREILYHVGFFITHTVYFLQTCYFYYISGQSFQNIRFGKKSSNFLDVYTINKPSAPLISMPVFLFIYGGAWGSGGKLLYAKMANLIRQQKVVVVIPNYSIYPKGTIEDMIEDVSHAVNWTYNNIEKYGGDKNRIHLVVMKGHSAGAHLSILYLIKRALYQLNGDESLGPYQRIDHRFNEMVPVSACIGLAGVYDIADHYLHEAERAVEHLSTMKPAMNGRENFDHHSPSRILRKASPSFASLIPPIYLIHGDIDKTVPILSSKKLMKELQKTGVKNVYYKELKNIGHSEIVFALMKNHWAKQMILNDLLAIINHK